MLLTTNGILRINSKELKFLPNGNAVLKMSCVSSEKFKKQDGTDGENTCWIDVISYGKQAEIINKFFEEKDRIYIVGKLKQEQWEKEGKKLSKHTLQVESFDFIERKNNQGQSQPRQQEQNSYQPKNVPEINIDDIDEIIPF